MLLRMSHLHAYRGLALIPRSADRRNGADERGGLSMRWAHTVAKTVGLAAVIAAGLVAPALAVEAGPTGATIDNAGITLPAGDTFVDGGTVAVSTSNGTFGYAFDAACVDSEAGDCEGTMHTLAQYIGTGFLPWSGLGLHGDFCVTWVNLSLYSDVIFTGTTDARCTGAGSGGLGTEPTGGVLSTGGTMDDAQTSVAPAAVAAYGEASYTG